MPFIRSWTPTANASDRWPHCCCHLSPFGKPLNITCGNIIQKHGAYFSIFDKFVNSLQNPLDYLGENGILSSIVVKPLNNPGTSPEEGDVMERKAYDLHCDTLMKLGKGGNLDGGKAMVTLEGLRQGGVALQCFADFVPTGMFPRFCRGALSGLMFRKLYRNYRAMMARPGR